MSWRALYLQGGTEFRAQDELRALGIETFCPYELHRKHKKNPNSETKRQIIRKVSKFPNYLFANSSRIAELKSARGVIGIVSANSVPLTIPTYVMDRLRSLCEVDGLMKQIDMTKNSYWFTGTPGDNFNFRASSPFFGLLGQITSIARLDKSGEISAWVELFGRRVDVDLPHSEVGEILRDNLLV